MSDFEYKLEIIDDMIHQLQDLATNPEDRKDIGQMIVAVNRISIRCEAAQEKSLKSKNN